MLEVKDSPIHGKGVFATKDIKKGITYQNHVIPLPDEECGNSIHAYAYPFNGSKFFCICAGYGSFFNHSNKPNVRVIKLDRKNLIKTFEFIRDIKAGEEIFLYYGNEQNETLAQGK